MALSIIPVEPFNTSTDPVADVTDPASSVSGSGNPDPLISSFHSSTSTTIFERPPHPLAHAMDASLSIPLSSDAGASLSFVEDLTRVSENPRIRHPLYLQIP